MFQKSTAPAFCCDLVYIEESFANRLAFGEDIDMMPPRYNSKCIRHFQFFNNLLNNYVTSLVMICNSFIIKLKPALHIAKICRRKTFLVREHCPHVKAQLIEESAAPFAFCFSLNYVPSQTPVELQHFRICSNSSLCLALPVTSFQFFQPSHIFLVCQHTIT